LDKYEIVKRIENFAPLETQEKWDASGWIVDKPDSKVNRIMFALTVTPQIVNQAIKKQCDMIISHHPLFKVPFEYSKINIYCAHTNLDKAQGGTTDLILKKLGFKGENFNDFVRIVTFDEDRSIEYLKLKLLPIAPRLKYINNTDIKTVRRVAFCAGSGSEFIDQTPCDAFITGDVKFHTAVEADKIIFDIGHFESEVMAVGLLQELAQVGDKGVVANEKSPFI
jgi:dinuclear metal center YbgI/SA1388 family protein